MREICDEKKFSTLHRHVSFKLFTRLATDAISQILTFPLCALSTYTRNEKNLGTLLSICSIFG